MALDAFRAPEYLCAVPGAETKVTSTLSTGESYGNIFEQSTSPLRTMTESKSVMFRYGRFGRQASQRICRGMSKLLRNVPFLTSIEMSPFFVLYFFLLFSAVALEKVLASKPQERRSSSRSTYGMLAWPGA